MKYTVLGFSQVRLCELGLDLNDALILRWFVDFYSTGKMHKITNNGVEYVQVSYKALLADIPIIGLKSHDSLKRRMNKMVAAGLFESYTHKVGGTFSCYRLSDVYETVIKCTDANQGGTTQKSEGYDSKVVGGTTQKSEQKNPSTRSNQSTTSNKSAGASADKKGKAVAKEGGKEKRHPPTPLTKSLQDIVGEQYLPEGRAKALQEWLDYKKEKRQGYKPIGLRKLLKQWDGKSDAEFIQAVDNSIAANYAGLFAPRGNRPSGIVCSEDI